MGLDGLTAGAPHDSRSSTVSPVGREESTESALDELAIPSVGLRRGGCTLKELGKNERGSTARLGRENDDTLDVEKIEKRVTRGTLIVSSQSLHAV